MERDLVRYRNPDQHTKYLMRHPWLIAGFLGIIAITLTACGSDTYAATQASNPSPARITCPTPIENIHQTSIKFVDPDQWTDLSNTFMYKELTDKLPALVNADTAPIKVGGFCLGISGASNDIILLLKINSNQEKQTQFVLVDVDYNGNLNSVSKPEPITAPGGNAVLNIIINDRKGNFQMLTVQVMDNRGDYMYQMRLNDIQMSQKIPRATHLKPLSVNKSMRLRQRGFNNRAHYGYV